MLSEVQLMRRREHRAILMPREPSKDQKSRLGFFIDWLAWTQRPWYSPDLTAYRDYLLKERRRIDRQGRMIHAPLSPRTALAHLSTIRSRYDALTRSNEVRDRLYLLTRDADSPAVRKAMVDELFVRLANDVHPATAPIRLIEKQDIADSEHLRLKPYQVSALVQTPGISSLQGLRDTALMTLMVCTGIRAYEAADVRVDDLRQRLGGELALCVRSGKGGKQRLIPYGPLDWCLVYVEGWLKQAGIGGGAVFRGIRRGGKTIRDEGIGSWTVNDIMNSHPIMIDGDLRTVKPHDLRRTYARNAYDFGMDLERIRQNLGHASLQTTQTYIGELDGAQRHPPNMFAPPHDRHTLRQLTGSMMEQE